MIMSLRPVDEDQVVVLGELVFRPAGAAAWFRTSEMATRDENGWFYAAYRLGDEHRAERRPERMSA